jgi:diguanylate cyclase (GGDEF)-like protein
MAPLPDASTLAPGLPAGDPAGSRQQAVAKMLRVVVASWLVDAAQLAVLAGIAGVDAWRAFWCLTIGGTALCAVLFLVLASGWNRRLRDPSMTVPHLLAWSAVIITGAAASPEVAVLALSTLFLVFSFASLRLAPMPLLASLVAVSAGLGALVAAQPAPLTVPMATPVQAALSVLWVSLVLGRCALLGLHGARLRSRLGQRTRELAEATARLHHLATHDPLTGALNRGAIHAALDAVLTVAPTEARGGCPDTCIVLVDLDHFKSINDSHGHPVGDEVLRRFAGIVSATLPPAARFGRYGGEEFLVVLQCADSPQLGRLVAEGLRLRLRSHPWHEVVPGLRVSVSAGVANARPGEAPHALLSRADQNLYRAKRLGRDRVCADEPAAQAADDAIEALGTPRG